MLVSEQGTHTVGYIWRTSVHVVGPPMAHKRSATMKSQQKENSFGSSGREYTLVGSDQEI